MKRTTLMFDESIFRRLKQEASQAGKSMGEYLNGILKVALFGKKEGLRPFQLKFVTFKGTGKNLPPVDDRDRLFDALDDPLVS
jgi:hypothetical protein